jgi:hypothetical protein
MKPVDEEIDESADDRDNHGQAEGGLRHHDDGVDRRVQELRHSWRAARARPARDPGS